MKSVGALASAYEGYVVWGDGTVVLQEARWWPGIPWIPLGIGFFALLSLYFDLKSRKQSGELDQG